MAIIRNPQGAFFEQTQQGLKVINDPRTLQSLFQGQLPYRDVSDLNAFVISPEVSNPELTPTATRSLNVQQPIVPPTAPQTAQQNDPLTLFNLAILDMLKQAQGTAGNESLYAQQRGLQRAAIGRQAEVTPEELRQLSPTQQAAIRTGKISALEPEIDAISAKIKANDSRLTNFESILGTMREMGQDLAKVTPSEGVIQGYVGMLKAGGQPTSIPEEIRNSVMSKMTTADWDDWFVAINYKAPSAPSIPSSYQEYILAQKDPKFAEFLAESNIKAPTAAQQTVAEYAARLEQAEPILVSLQDGISGMNRVAFATQLAMPATLRSAEMKQYTQAASNFINAKLRRESGAVIASSEFTEARSQYLPAAGDSDELLKQKKANRDLVFASMRKAAGTAYSSVEELLGTQSDQFLVTAPNGKTYSFPSQEAADQFKQEAGIE